MKKCVAIHKKSNMAFAPDQLVKCINKYSSKYMAILVISDAMRIVVDNNITAFENEFNQAEIIHFNNKNIPEINNIPQLIQYHSPPSYVNLDYNLGPKLVIAQYQATLPEYQDCKLVRNIIDIYENIFNPAYNESETIRIGFSPSNKHDSTAYESKGYYRTINALNNIKSRYNNVEIDIIEGVPLRNCLQRKAKCDIIIDECATKSYHRSGLEGLAMGKLTICSLGDEVKEILQKASRAPEINNRMPFYNIWIDDLERQLEGIINNGKPFIIAEGKKRRIWMEQYWNPKDIVNEYEQIYDAILTKR